MHSITRFAYTLAAFTIGAVLYSSRAHSAAKIDLGLELVGRGYSSASYSCKDGTTLSARYEVRADRGETLVLSVNGQPAGMIARFLKASDAEISQCVTGTDFEGRAATLCYRSPGQLESIDLGYLVGSSFQSTSHCFVQSVKKTRE